MFGRIQFLAVKKASRKIHPDAFFRRLKSASRLNRRPSDFPGFGNASGWSKSKVFRQQIVRQFNNQSVVLDQTMTYKLSTIQMRL